MWYNTRREGEKKMKTSGTLIWRVVLSLLLSADITVGVLQLVRDKSAAQVDLYSLVGKIAVQACGGVQDNVKDEQAAKSCQSIRERLKEKQ